MTNGKKDILIIMGRYLPGYKDGGPVRSIKNLTDFLGEEYNFKILTCDRDHGDTKPYENIKVFDFNRVGRAEVFYVPPGQFKTKLICNLANKADLVYVCGCFNDYAINTLIAKRLGKIKTNVVVAAMGLFSPMEFRLKYKKKKLFTVVFNTLGMFKNIYWSATSEMEISEILQQVKGRKEQFFIAQDLPRIVDNTQIKKERADALKVVWISRIAPKKNLLGAIKVLQQGKSNVEFTIYGPVHDEDYWAECKNELAKLPPNVAWQYKGNVDSERVVDTLKPYNVFLFNTLGENYGHVIQEALSAGCACVLSDQTPWQDLAENGAGYVYSLDDEEKFVQSIENYAQMSAEQLQKCADNALAYAVKNSNKKAENTGYRVIFDKLSR